MSTRKLYYEDSHRRRFLGTVTGCVEAEGGYEITLDATCFYPEGGGQAADTGRLGDARVLDTRERGEDIVHLCDRPLELGAALEGEIDWEPRFARMQLHSGEHIVSGILHRRFGVSNTGFHMGAERTVIDFDGVIPPEALASVEAEANASVWQNIPLRIWYPTPQELPEVPYRSKRALPWPVRIVEIPGYDTCACCGTHVGATGEIGIIKLYSSVPFRGGSRIEMSCGSQALAYLNRVLGQAAAASHVFSVPADQVGEAAQSFSAQAAGLKYRIVELQRRLFAMTAAQCAGRGDVLLMEPGLDSVGIRELADALAGTCGGTAAVFSGTDAGGYGYCLAHRQEDLRPLGREMTAALSGRGGGKPNFQQGRVAAPEKEIRTFFIAHGWTP